MQDPAYKSPAEFKVTKVHAGGCRALGKNTMAVAKADLLREEWKARRNQTTPQPVMFQVCKVCAGRAAAYAGSETGESSSSQASDTGLSSQASEEGLGGGGGFRVTRCFLTGNSRGGGRPLPAPPV